MHNINYHDINYKEKKMKEFNIKDVKIEKIAFFDTKKDGSPLVTKAGKPFKRFY